MTTRDTTAPPAGDGAATITGGTAQGGVDGPVPAITATVREPLGRRFAVHLTGVGIANLADGLILVGVPLVAITLTRSPGQISLIQVAFWLPWLLLGLVAGVVVDRSDRRHVQLVGGAARLAVVAGLAALAVTDNLSIPLLVAGVGLYGVTQVFVDLAGSSIVPQLVPRSRLTAANGRVMGLEQIGTNFLGSPVAGFLVAAGAGWVFGVPVALGVAFLLVLGLGMRGDFRPRRSAKTEPVGSRLQQVLEGLRLQVRHPVLRPLLIAQSVLNFASTAYFAVFVLWMVGAESAVGMTPERYALLAALLAVGAIVGSFLAEHVSRWLPEVPVLVASWAIQFGALLVPVLVPEPWAIGAALVVVGLLNMIGNVVIRTLRQRLIPADALGRVGGAGGMIGYGLMPLGALAGGLVGELWGLPAVFVGTVVLALAVIAYVATRISTRLVAEHEIEHDDAVA